MTRKRDVTVESTSTVTRKRQVTVESTVTRKRQVTVEPTVTRKREGRPFQASTQGAWVPWQRRKAPTTCTLIASAHPPPPGRAWRLHTGPAPAALCRPGGIRVASAVPRLAMAAARRARPAPPSPLRTGVHVQDSQETPSRPQAGPPPSLRGSDGASGPTLTPRVSVLRRWSGGGPGHGFCRRPGNAARLRPLAKTHAASSAAGQPNASPAATCGCSAPCKPPTPTLRR